MNDLKDLEELTMQENDIYLSDEERTLINKKASALEKKIILSFHDESLKKIFSWWKTIDKKDEQYKIYSAILSLYLALKTNLPIIIKKRNWKRWVEAYYQSQIDRWILFDYDPDYIPEPKQKHPTNKSFDIFVSMGN